MAKLQSARPIEYELLQPLIEGGFSTVYKALRRDLEFGLEQIVALKILKSKIDLEKWRDEFISLERVQSSRCVRVLGWDYIDGCPSLILDWIEGVTLSDWIEWLQAQNRTAENLAVSRDLIDELCAQIIEGLSDIHVSDNIHGDLSLQNIMLTAKGEIKLLDFGLASSKELNFTAEFVAPELLMGARPSKATDLYSLGRIREYLERRMKLPLSATTKALLHPEPNHRVFISAFEATSEERNERQKILAENLKNLNLQQRLSTKLKPQTQVASDLKQKSSWIKNLSYASVLAFSLNVGNAAPDTRPAHLFIKTKQWVEITIDGRRIGYTPLDVELVAGRNYKVEWRTKTSSGQRSLTPEPGQNMFISDHFFAP
jgi:serine/threonine protein kinase